MTGDPPVNSINAYSSTTTNLGNNISRKILIVSGIFFMLLVFRNAIFRDYNNETKNYLTSTGHTDIIDNIIPKTATEIKLERLNKDELLIDLAKNLTTLIDEVQQMKIEIEKLKGQQVNNIS